VPSVPLLLRVFVECSGATLLLAYDSKPSRKFISVRIVTVLPPLLFRAKMEILYTFLDACLVTINGYRNSLNSWSGGHVEQIYKPAELLELLRIYQGSVTSVTFLSKTDRKVDEKLISKTKQNVRCEDLNGIDEDFIRHGSPYVGL
jgi:hypothetical protein